MWKATDRHRVSLLFLLRIVCFFRFFFSFSWQNSTRDNNNKNNQKKYSKCRHNLRTLRSIEHTNCSCCWVDVRRTCSIALPFTLQRRTADVYCVLCISFDELTVIIEHCIRFTFMLAVFFFLFFACISHVEWCAIMCQYESQRDVHTHVIRLRDQHLFFLTLNTNRNGSHVSLAEADKIRVWRKIGYLLLRRIGWTKDRHKKENKCLSCKYLPLEYQSTN